MLAHPKFVAGDFNTGFIAENYGQRLSRPRTCRTTTRPSCWRWRPTSIAACCSRAAGISGQLPGHGVTVGEEFAVVGLGAAGQNTTHPVTVRNYQAQTGSGTVEVGGKEL